jgi:4-hydroxy-tetrahydrodipicolinate synthase
MHARIRVVGAHTAIITPFTDDGSALDAARLESQVIRQCEGGVTSVVPCGTTGEAPTLDEREHAAAIECAVAAARPRGVQVIAGAGSNSTADAVRMHRTAAALGADAALHVAPYYNKPSQEGIYRHFMAVADSSDLPIVLYSIPGRCGVAIAPETVERLNAHPNIVAIKEATGSLDSASEIRRRCAIAVLSGDDSLTIGFAAVGAVGVVSVISNVAPARVAAMCAAITANDFAAARAIHEALYPLARGLLSIDTNPVPVKCAMELLGLDSGAVRLPMVRASEQARAQVRALLAHSRGALDGAAVPLRPVAAVA